MRALQQSPPGTSGAFTGLLRVLLRYPEVLAWEYQYRLSREETAQAIYKTVKAIKPAAQVGWHVDHQQSSWDQVYRAEMTYGEMAAYSDFIKPIVYHDILAPRIRWWYLDRLQKSVLSEIPLDESLDFYYETFDYDRQREPSADQLDKSGFSPDYVYRETRRTVVETAGKAKVYQSFRRPVERAALPERPRKRLSSGIEGLRRWRGWDRSLGEYDEMRLPNLKAVGTAVRAAIKGSLTALPCVPLLAFEETERSQPLQKLIGPACDCTGVCAAYAETVPYAGVRAIPLERRRV